MVKMAVEMAGARQAMFETAMEVEIAVEMAGVARASAASAAVVTVAETVVTVVEAQDASATALEVSAVARVEATVVATDMAMEAAETVGVAMEAA